VPVIRNVEKMNYAAIEKAIADLGEKVRVQFLISFVTSDPPTG
jgi:pyruvate/2-oxoglutarate dehydrogenase complex dihydrolipoamide acyltransferase (E2) component